MSAGKRESNPRGIAVFWDDLIHVAVPKSSISQRSKCFAVNRNYRTINAEAQIRDENSVLHYYKRLIALRHEKPVIVYGDYHMLLKEDPDVFAYERTLDGVKLTVICNFADHEVECPLLSNDAEILISNYQDRAQSVLRPFEAVVYETVSLSSCWHLRAAGC